MRKIAYRDVVASDFDDLLAVVSEWEVVRQLGAWPWPPDEEFTLSRSKPFDGKGFVWAICDDDRLVGSVAITNGTLGYMLSPSFSGVGVMSTAVRAALEIAFKNYDFDLVSACTWFDNPASVRVLEKAGFAKTGECEEHAKARDVLTRSFNFELTRDRWQTLRSHAQ